MPVELKKHTIDLLSPKSKQSLQVTLNEDVNVPDVKPDIDRILQSSANVVILKEELLDDKFIIQGELRINVLYIPLNDKKPIHIIETNLPIEETLNVDEVTEKDIIKLETNIEDINITTTNTRKVNAKAIVNFNIKVNEMKHVYVTNDIEGNNHIEKKGEEISYCQLIESSKETYIIKDEFKVADGKPNIMEILWYESSIQNKEIKLLDGKINVKGTLHIATLYMGEDSENSLEFVEHDIAFNGLIDSAKSSETMVHDIDVQIVEDSIGIKPDIDEEERVLEVKVETKLNIKIYSEEETTSITDVYSLEKDLDVKKENVTFQKLLLKNQSQCNIKESILIDEDNPDIMQIYNASGDVTIDHVEYLDDKIKVEGAVICRIMYVAANDSVPINVYKTIIPYEHTVQARQIKKESISNISSNINYINCTMIGDKEVEVKCIVNISCIVFDESSIEVISSIDEKEINLTEIYKLPGIIGYIVKEKDTMWDIAKKYKTKIQSIKETNGLESTTIKKGDKLIIVKDFQVE
jgi:hypothetical protein